ncbi:MAG: hypothetical protein HY609_02035, partial [Deltaproteobacteria bacterium]|nr:hypothetical protein [Deltaproteobacteria bacterium]
MIEGPAIVTNFKKSRPLWSKILIILGIISLGLIAVSAVGWKITKWYLSGKMVKVGWITKPDKGFIVDLETGGFVLRGEKTGQEIYGLVFHDKLPVWIPKDLPIFPSATITSSMVLGPSKSVLAMVNAPPEEVVTYYQGEMASKGWSEVSSSRDEGSFEIKFRRDQQTAIIEVRATEEKKTVALNLSIIEERRIDEMLEMLEEDPTSKVLREEVLKKVDELLETQTPNVVPSTADEIPNIIKNITTNPETGDQVPENNFQNED